MAVLAGPQKIRIKGWKELSENEPIAVLQAQEEVCIPVFGFRGCTFETCVKVGDKVCIGSLLAKCDQPFAQRIYASVSGEISEIANSMHFSLKPQIHIHIKNDQKNTVDAPLKPLDYNKASVSELINFMKETGLVGLGGAGFPTYKKYENVKGVDTLVINGVECEPYITSDYAFAKQNKAALLVGILAMKKMSGAQQAIVAIKKTQKVYLELVKEIVRNQPDVRVVDVDDLYPMGWERALVLKVLNKKYQKLPVEAGALVNNLSTAIAFGLSLNSGMPNVRSIMTISGDAIKKPQNVDVPIGYPIPDIIDACQGIVVEDVKLIVGGPMMGNTMVNDKIYADQTMNALTILKNIEYRSVACLRCGKCSDVCPQGLQPVRIVQAYKANDKFTIQKLEANDCVECGLCSYFCPSKLEVSENVRRAKKSINI